jgi:hypothetical protein
MRSDTASDYLEAIADIPRPHYNLLNPDAGELIRRLLEADPRTGGPPRPGAMCNYQKEIQC